MNAKQLAGLTDAELLVFAFRDLTQMVGAELKPGSTADRALVGRLLAIIDRSDIVSALDRLERRYGMRPLPKSD